MTNPRLSSQRLPRHIIRHTSPGSLPSKSGSEKGECLSPPDFTLVGGFFQSFRAALLTGVAVTPALYFAEARLRQFAPTDLAHLTLHRQIHILEVPPLKRSTASI